MKGIRARLVVLLILFAGACAPALQPVATHAPEPPPGDVRVRDRDGAQMVFVPEGEFVMGSSLEMSRDAKKLCESSKGDSARAACKAAAFTDERPAHRVALDAFWIDRTEVTNRQYASCVQAGVCDPPLLNSSFSRTSYYGDPAYDDFPVLNVLWDMAAGYCAWAQARLPTEAEWEYAARGPEDRVYPWGNDFDGSRLNYCDVNCPLLEDPSHNDGYADTSPVGAFASGASWVGAVDMVGNVREWVNDWLGVYPSGETINPTGPATGESKIPRGGSWYDTPDDVRSTNRGGELLDYWRDNLGFRCVQDAH